MIPMIDLDILVKVGWTALLGWNLRETVSIGKRVVRLETRLENGLTEKLDSLSKRIELHVNGEEERILRALQRNPALRTRRSDRKRGEADDA